MAVVAALVASLTITVWPDGRDGASHTYAVRCPGAAVCAQLAKVGRAAFRPVPPDVVCTELYGGPQQALVVGRIGGQRVWARFKRTNGCETGRWNRLAFLFRA